MGRAPWLLFLLALAVRGFVAWRTLVPERDAAHYLWMAERLAQGDPRGLFVTVFHPLYSVLVGSVLRLAPSLDPVVAGQIVSGALGAFALLPLWRVAERTFGARAATFAAFLYAIGTWFARHPADALSEGPFYLLVASTIDVLTRPKVNALLGGFLVALAYGTRPEGISLALVGIPWLWLRGERRAAIELFATSLVFAAAWPLGWALLGEGFTLTPKAAFNWEVGVGDEVHGGAAHWFASFGRLLLDLPDAIGFVALPLALAGIARARPRPRTLAALLLAPLVLQLVAAAFLRSHVRFLSGYGILLLPFAGHAWNLLPARALRLALALLALGIDAARLPLAEPRRADRVVERDLGRFLRPRLLPGQRLVTEMPRLEYYAGQRPGPPRPIPAEEIERLARRHATRFLAIVAQRTPLARERILALGFHPMALPPTLAAQLTTPGREVWVFQR